MTTEPKDTTSRAHAKFGGSQFSYQIELCFAEFTDILDSILNSKIQDLPHPTGLILANLHQTSKAALSLAPDGLVNEAYLLMRVLIDTGVTFSYLLEADNEERKAYLEQQATIFLGSRCTWPRLFVLMGRTLMTRVLNTKALGNRFIPATYGCPVFDIRPFSL
jgi:hypothetical protein